MLASGPIVFSRSQYIALVALSEEDEHIVTELGEKLVLESNTLTPSLKKLDQAGYLCRTRGPPTSSRCGSV